MCEYLIVGVGTDDFMIRRKNRTSILSYEQRVEIVKAIRYVDEVVPENDLDKIADDLLEDQEIIEKIYNLIRKYPDKDDCCELSVARADSILENLLK